MMRVPIRRVLAAVLGAAVLSVLLLLPTYAQTPAPAQPPPTAAPVPTPTRTIGQILGIEQPVRDGGELLARFGPLGALGLLVVAVIVGFVFALGRTTGENFSTWLYRRVFGRRLEKREQRIEQAATAREQQQLTAAAMRDGMTAYLDWLQNEDDLKYLPLIPIKGSKQQEQLPLADVYVPLRVVEREQIEQFRRLTVGDFDDEGEFQRRSEAFEAVRSTQVVYRLLSDAAALPQEPEDGTQPPAPFTTQRLLLVGDAGSGKTTTLHYGALVLAGALSAANAKPVRQTMGLYATQPLTPFYIRLTLVATYVRECSKRADSAALPRLADAPASLLLDWFDSYLYAQSGNTVPADFASRSLAAGNCLVLLDGLDETGDAAARDYIQRLIANFANDARYRNNRFLVTSRPFEHLALPGFAERHLAPLDDDDIQKLLTNWFGAIRRYGTSRRASESLEQQVGYLSGILNDNPRLFEMATNPLLLTTMALLVHHGDELPRERAEIYNRLVPLLLKKWREVQIGGGKPGGQDGMLLYDQDESESSVQRRLQELAADMQEKQQREIRLEQAQAVLQPVYTQLLKLNDEQAADRVARLLESLALHSGLIQARDRGYSFTHYTIQEYLTARAYDLRENGVELLHARWREGRWRETVLLAVGHWATGGTPEKAQRLLRLLLEQPEPEALLLAASALHDADAPRVPELRSLQNDAIVRLRQVAFDPAALPDPRKRNRAATLLDLFGGDDRAALDPASDDYWTTPIAPGPFRMGSTAADNGAHDGEKPAFVYTISERYALAKFPVTNRQYAQFLASIPDSEQQQRRRPRYWPEAGYRAGEGNHPVVGVSLLDAMAFAAWVDETYYQNRGVVRLPTEPEWERAAAYPIELPPNNPAHGRRTYAWGNDFPSPAGRGARGEGDLTETNNSGRIAALPANIAETNIGNTSVVGIFPHGAAACGACDITGNVWEWCCTPFVPYREIRDRGLVVPETLDSVEKDYSANVRRTYVLRGGAWRYNRSNARCAYRGILTPDNFDDYVGLRLARRLPA